MYRYRLLVVIAYRKLIKCYFTNAIIALNSMACVKDAVLRLVTRTYRNIVPLGCDVPQIGIKQYYVPFWLLNRRTLVKRDVIP